MPRRKEKEMKKLFKKLGYWFNWLFDRKVLEAINDGCTYDEVDKIAKGD